MKISVITVTYNALPALRRTVDSVLAQDYSDFECIVIDGGSSDGTPAFLERNAEKITRWVSEPDSGIYEAMNKGVRMAEGDFCIFMNAGDLFVNNYVLERVAPHLDGSDIVLGNELLVNEQGRICGLTPAKGAFTDHNLFLKSVCHQATFIRRNVLLDHPYDESLRMVSDWKFILERYLDKTYIFKTVNQDICFFFQGGITDKHKETGYKERNHVLASYPRYTEKHPFYFINRLVLRVWSHMRMIVKRYKYHFL